MGPKKKQRFIFSVARCLALGKVPACTENSVDSSLEVTLSPSGYALTDGAGHLMELSVHSETLPWARHGAEVKTNALDSLDSLDVVFHLIMTT